MTKTLETTPDALAVRKALRRVLDSPEFVQSERMRAMLEFIVETALEGKAAELKETVIGTAVFRRPPGYDPKADGIVRSEARRLRSKLQHYYAESGAADPLVIDLPRGAYVPQFGDRVTVAPVAPASVVDDPAPVRREPNRWMYFLAGLTLFCTLGTVYTVRRQSSQAKAPRLLTDQTGNCRAPRFSPDGRRVVYSRDVNAVSHILVRQVDSGAVTQITSGAVMDYEPAWAPDGKHIAFVRRSSQGADVRIADLQRHTERVVTTIAELNAIDWSPDGKWIGVADRQADTVPRAIVLVSADTGGRRVLTNPKLGTLGDKFPRFSRDGKSVAFQRVIGEDHSRFFLVDVDRPGSERQIAEGGVAIGGHCWSADGRTLVAALRRSKAPWSLYRVFVTNGTVERIPEAGLDPGRPDVSSTDNRIVYSVQTLDVNIWEASLAGGGPDLPVAASGALDNSPQVSPDGRRLAFRSTRTGSNEIWLWDRVAKSATALTHFNDPVTGSPHWSPDGKQIAFDSRPEKNADIYRVAVEGGTPVRLTEGPSSDVVPNWSRDGRTVYFASDRSGQWQVWRVAEAGGAAQQVTWNGGFAAAESPDRKWLYYSKRTGSGGLWRQALAGGPEELVVADLIPSQWGQWALDGAGAAVYFMFPTPSNGLGEIRRMDLRDNSVQVVRRLAKTPVLWDSAVALDPAGKSLFYTQIDNASSDLYILD